MSLDATPLAPAQLSAHDEARRQSEICNACRYCEGFCDVFPAMFRERAFADGDITQLANLCHNCRGCYYSCQYTEPHEFAINIPRALAEVRSESWDLYAWPMGFARLFQRSGTVLALGVVLGAASIFLLMRALGPAGGAGFYAHLSHAAMVAVFLLAFLFPLLAIAVALSRYWRAVGGAPVRWVDLRHAAARTASLRNLSGGQGQGCNFEKGDRYSNARRHAHQAVLWGFLLCFAATSSGTVMHYGLGWEAPYPVWSLPKLLGVPGGILLTIGCAGLAWLKTQADPALSDASIRGGEMAFVLMLGLTGLSGLALYAATGTGLVPGLLALHLGAVLAFFLTTPYSKMAHGFFRFAALVRDAQVRRR